MKQKKRTIKELFDLATENFQKNNSWFNERFLIVKGGHSRSVLKNFDTEVISYGVGFKGFVAIYKNKAGFLKATGYELYWIYSGYSKGKFVDLPILEADNMIKETKTFMEKSVHPNILEVPYRKPPIRTYKSLGSIRYSVLSRVYPGYVDEGNLLEIQKYKNGNYRGLLKSNRADNKVLNEQQIIRLLKELDDAKANKKLLTMSVKDYEELVKNKRDDFKEKTRGKEYIIIHNDIPDEVIQELREKQLIMELKRNG